MDYGNPDFRFVSEPVELRWLGWRTDTATLAKHGWDISANQNPQHGTMQIAIRKELKNREIYQGVSQVEEFFYAMQQDARVQQMAMRRAQIVRMRLGHGFRLIALNSISDQSSWCPIDATPSFTTEQANSLDDIVHFKKLNRDTKEIILQRASMDEVLKFALDKQLIRQDEIREELMKRKEYEDYKRDSSVQAELRLVA